MTPNSKVQIIAAILIIHAIVHNGKMINGAKAQTIFSNVGLRPN